MTGLPDLIGFQRALNHVGDRAVLAPSQPVRKITRLCAAHGKPRFDHVGLPLPLIELNGFASETPVDGVLMGGHSGMPSFNQSPQTGAAPFWWHPPQ